MEAEAPHALSRSVPEPPPLPHPGFIGWVYMHIHIYIYTPYKASMPRANRTNPPDTFTTGAAAPADGVAAGVLEEPLVAAVVVLVARVVEAPDEVEVSEAEVVAVAESEVVVAELDATDVEAETAEVAALVAVFVESMLNCGVKFEFPGVVSSIISNA